MDMEVDVGELKFIFDLLSGLQLVLMEDHMSTVRRWEDMEIDVLVKIFREFNIVEFVSGVSRVCGSWRLACSDPLIWKTLDLGMLKSNFIQIPRAPYIWVDDRSNKKLTRILKISMGLSRENVNCILFHFNLYPNDEQLIYVAESSPRLKRLILPAWNLLTKAGICKAIENWKGLESMTMPYINSPPYVMEKISRCCKNFAQLKVMGCFNASFALAIVTNLPKLKVLSLRCSMLQTEAVMKILSCLRHLEVLNISHCLFFEDNSSVKVIREIDKAIILKASKLQEFLYCQSESCILCQRMVKDKGSMKWFRYEERLWLADEVPSLAH